MTSFIIPIELYDSDIHVLNGMTDQEFEAYIADNFGINVERMESTAAFWTIYDKIGKAIYLMDFKKKLKKDYYSINTLAHECQHATFAILNRNHIPYEFNKTEEVYCCLNGFITGKIFEGVFKK